jgi:hypothetical protein
MVHANEIDNSDVGNIDGYNSLYFKRLLTTNTKITKKKTISPCTIAPNGHRIAPTTLGPYI